MIPQSYPLIIESPDGETRWLVVGWHDFGATWRPVVVKLGHQPQARADTLPGGIPWVVSAVGVTGRVG